MSTKEPNNSGAALSRGHTVQGVLGILGTLTLIISATTPRWYNNRGLWETQESSGSVNRTTSFSYSRAQEAQLFFFGISLIMAATSFCTCLIVLFCFKSQDEKQLSSPANLFLAILPPTGFFFFVSWTIFTCRHLEEKQGSWTAFGYSYWLGVLAWTVLLICVPILFLFSECIMYEESDTAEDILGEGNREVV